MAAEGKGSPSAAKLDESLLLPPTVLGTTRNSFLLAPSSQTGLTASSCAYQYVATTKKVRPSGKIISRRYVIPGLWAITKRLLRLKGRADSKSPFP